jgi:hypothetical protein
MGLIIVRKAKMSRKLNTNLQEKEAPGDLCPLNGK